jgi:U6 snRNA-associated Sm-like protein LSm1
VPPSYNTSVPPEAHLQVDAPVPPGLYADVPRGIFLVRGENVLLLGEIDLDKDDDAPPGYEKGEVDAVTKMDKERKVREAKREKSRNKKLGELGFEGDISADAMI